MAVIMMLVIMIVRRMIMPMMVMPMVVPVRGMILMAMVVVTAMIVLMAMVVVTVVVCAMGIGAALRLEGSADVQHRGAEPAQHVLDHVIAADEDEILAELGRKMPVAEVPGEADEMRRVARDDPGEWLRGSLHLDQPPILQRQPIAVTERARRRQVEEEFEPLLALHGDPPPMALVMVEEHDIGRRAGPRFSHPDGADHGRFPSQWRARAALSQVAGDWVTDMAGNLKQSPGHCHAAGSRTGLYWNWAWPGLTVPQSAPTQVPPMLTSTVMP